MTQDERNAVIEKCVQVAAQTNSDNLTSGIGPDWDAGVNDCAAAIADRLRALKSPAPDNAQEGVGQEPRGVSEAELMRDACVAYHTMQEMDWDEQEDGEQMARFHQQSAFALQNLPLPPASAPAPEGGDGELEDTNELEFAQSLFADELEKRSEHSLASLVRTGKDNSHGGTAAVDAILVALRRFRPSPAPKEEAVARVDAAIDSARVCLGLEMAAHWHDERARDTPDAFETELHQVSAKAIRDLRPEFRPSPPPDVSRLVEALKKIAWQKTLAELSDEGEDCEGDFEGAYDSIIEIAREALAKFQKPAEGEEG